MKRPTLTAVLAIAPSLMVTGCATSSGACDPSREDFFSNTSCLVSGGYRQRERNLQLELEQERRRNDAFQAVLEGLRAEEAQVRGTLHSRQAAYAQLDAAWRDLKHRLNAEQRQDPALAARIERIDEQIQQRKTPALQADTERKLRELEDLKSQIEWMQKDLNAGF